MDGLDEGSSEAATRVAAQMLQVFLDTNDIVTVASGRPEILRTIPLHRVGWQGASIAPLTVEQRDWLALKWFRLKRISSDERSASTQDEALVLADVERLREELQERPELDQLSRVPLLLVLLLYLRFHQAALPRRRFDAFRELLETMIRVHPAARLAAASVAAAPLPIDERSLREVLSFLAFWVQTRGHVSTWTEDDVRPDLEGFLSNEDIGLQLERVEARQAVRTFLEAGERVGILTAAQSAREFAFFHRSIQEFLCAQHIARIPFEGQRGLVRSHCSDERWREVILALLWTTTRPGDVRALVEEIRECSKPFTESSLIARDLLSEVAFGDYRCPAPFVRAVADAAFSDVEQHAWEPHRRRIATHVLQGLRSSALRGAFENVSRGGCSREASRSDGVSRVSRRGPRMN